MLLIALAATAGALFSFPASAQVAPADPDEADIVITATGRSAAVSTTKSATPILESPQSISIISKEELDLRPSPNVADALAYTAGVVAAPGGVDSRVDDISVRGFGAGGFSVNNNFLDGLRLPASGTFSRTATDSYSLEQIEVLKGPSGALYGQSAPGGLVNLVTKRPTEQFRAEFMLQGVGYADLGKGNGQAAADISGPLSSTLSARFVGLARYGDTQLDNVENSRYYVSPSLTWRPGANTSWTLLGQYQRDEGGSTFQFVPALGSLYPNNGRVIDNETFLGEPGFNTYDRDQYLVASFFEHRFSDHIAVRNNSRYTSLETLLQGVAPAGNTLTACPANIQGCVPGQTLLRRGNQGTGSSKGITTDTQVEAKFATGAVGHTLLGGFDYFRTSYDSQVRQASTPTVFLPLLNIFDPRYRGTAGFHAALPVVVSSDAVANQFGVYLQDQIEVGKLRVTVGGRKDWTRDDTRNLLTNARFENEYDAFTWRAGAVYLFDNGLAPYASYAESFQPLLSDPSTSLNGEPFVPTTGQAYEAGLRYQGGNNIYLTLGAYQITQQNLTTPDPAGTRCGINVCLVQTGEGRIRGIEFEAKANLRSGTTLIGSVSRLDGEITKSSPTIVGGVPRTVVGNRLPQVPDWTASALVSQSFRDGALAGLSVGGGVRYIGDTAGDTLNDLAIPDYTLFDLFLRYDLGRSTPALEGVSVSVYARNLADKSYIATCGGITACRFGDGRSVTARLAFRW